MSLLDFNALRQALVKFRAEKRWSQDEFGRSVGLSKRTVHSFENGGVVDWKTVEKIAAGIGAKTLRGLADIIEPVPQPTTPPPPLSPAGQ